MTSFFRLCVGLTLLALISACSSSATCDKPQSYQQSQQGRPLVVPPDLSVPSSATRLEVPDTGANDIQPGECLDVPPRFVAVTEVMELSKEEREERNRRDVIRSTLQAWAQSWAGKNVEFHESIYYKKFKPGDGSTREEFLDQRRADIEATSDDVEIRLTEMTIDSTRKKATVRFVQVFGGTNAPDPVRREIAMEFSRKVWRIVGETILPPGAEPVEEGDG